ncbi:uncharacterized protein FA14DRAFT_83730 [Meira miltonrushii]|uniref:Serine hydrolase domain-containing protein n=1 Tax=Meira miltonrushii TaxID=1280837 RepID=A0A316V692_9BASI|nr:uncharacterized protein FA14DRAFT_83730 [Meira miltonrushii]PWN31991.1 hypothetical protein FA14DRAFT_83730 [Meira miltonrushii]
MTEPTYRRRNRILCLHGPTQSAASFRAALKPICDRMDRNWEFHFLDAPFIIQDPDSTPSQRQDTDTWTEAAILTSQAAAIDAELDNAKDNKQRDNLQQIRSESWQTLNKSKEGQLVWEAHQNGGADAVESLISSKVAQSMCRDWIVKLPNAQTVGVDVGLDLIGDYMREQGTFHGVIGFDSGSTLAILVQALLSHPRSSTQAFPTFFAQLPKGISRMPRMGGWEEQPPAPDDSRLGSENLTKDYVPAQKPFEAIIAYHPDAEILGERVRSWLTTKQPILKINTSADSFINHSLAIEHPSKLNPYAQELEQNVVYDQDTYVFDKDWTTHLTEFLILAIESGQGDQSARKRITESLSIPSSKSYRQASKL